MCSCPVADDTGNQLVDPASAIITQGCRSHRKQLCGARKEFRVILGEEVQIQVSEAEGAGLHLKTTSWVQIAVILRPLKS